MIPFILYLFILFRLNASPHAQIPGGSVLSVKTMSLNNRYPVPSVNEVFKQNILLTLIYMKQKGTGDKVEIKSVDQPIHYSLTLHKGEVFAFHDKILPAYYGKVVATTHAHFNGEEGFRSDGYLTGDGVCHLASLIDYVASSAGLRVEAPTSHDFANIPQVPKQYGVAIYTTPGEPTTSAQQNLYITNTLGQDITMVFDYSHSLLKVSIIKQSS